MPPPHITGRPAPCGRGTTRTTTPRSPTSTTSHPGGGYQAIINGRASPPGRPWTTASGRVRQAGQGGDEGLGDAPRRREAEESRAAHEAWLTYLKEREAKKALATQEMSFGGTIVSPQINADAKVEITA
jgi:hypothetical protein